MSEDLVLGLFRNLFLLGTTFLLIILLHIIFQWRFKKNGLTDRQIRKQWDDLVKVATNIEAKVAEGEVDWNSPLQVYDFIEEVTERKNSDILADIREETARAGKGREELITSCEAIAETLNSKERGRKSKILGWKEAQEWSQLPGRLLAYLIALLKKAGQVSVRLSKNAFSIELTEDASCSRETLECLLEYVRIT